MKLRLTKEEIEAIEQNLLDTPALLGGGTAMPGRSGYQNALKERITDAQLRKALWALHGEMESKAGGQTSQQRAWDYCSFNVSLWLEMADIEPWPTSTPDPSKSPLEPQ